jgi:hypothetical protein
MNVKMWSVVVLLCTLFAMHVYMCYTSVDTEEMVD